MFDLVELLRGYSNQEQVLAKLSNLLHLPDKDPGQPSHRRPKQLQHHLTAEGQQRVMAAYQAGGSVYDLARDFFISRQTAAAILERHGIKRRYNVLTPEMIIIAINLYEGGSSLARVGDQLDVDAGTIRKALLDAGIKTRPVGTNQWSR